MGINNNETKPLLPTGNGANGSNNQPPKSNSVPVLIASGLLLLGVGVWIGSSLGSPAPASPLPLRPSMTIEETPAASRIRPFCTLHNNDGTTSSARILQTSMADPSRQWAELPCYDDAALEGSEPNNNNIYYQAPDAVFRTLLSKPAFPERQPIKGFGAAFTEAASLNYQSLSDAGKERLMELMFGKSGLGYSIGRVPLNSCDFSVKSYSFDDVDGDFELDHFDTNVTHDAQKDGMIDMILRATAVFDAAWRKHNVEEGEGEHGLAVFASPWSPPSWMKAVFAEDDFEAGLNHANGMTGSAQPSCLREGTGPDSRYAKAWAGYMSKFVRAYKDHGVALEAVTVQNEPEFPAPWEACSYTPETQADFIAHHLGPQLEQDHPDVSIYMFDHNKDHLVTWAETVLDPDHPSSQYVSGSAYHWYAGGMDRLLDGAVGSPNLHRMQATLEKLGVPSDHLVFNSEACHCPYTGYGGGSLEVSWARAERYAHTILGDLMAGSNGWVEWNLVLDSIGGPNHLHNLCDATVLAVPHRAVGMEGIIEPRLDWEETDSTERFGYSVGDGRTREELNAFGIPAKHLDVGLAVQPMYFYMGHISRYVRPGSRAVMGLVDTARDGFRAFRSPGDNVAGGGMNELARGGMELTAWPCEGSTRQQFYFEADSGHLRVNGHDWQGNPTRSCVANAADASFLGVTLTDCNSESGVGTFQMVREEMSAYAKFVNATSSSDNGDTCLVLKRLENEGGAYGPRGGAQIAFGPCEDNPAALWLYSEATNEVVSNSLPEGPVCMTTGWPFLQLGAFETANGESNNTVVVLNEAHDSANYVLYDGDDLVLSGSIPPRSIQTILLD